MRFTVNGYEIDIRARRIDEEDDRLFNDDDTRSVFIDLACYLSDASAYNAEHGYLALSADAKEYGNGFRDTYQKFDRDRAILDSVDAGRKA